MKTIIDKLARLIAVQLDKLKVSNPIIFLTLEGALGVLVGLFMKDIINIPTPDILQKILSVIEVPDIDSLIIGLLVSIMAIIGPRTTTLKNGTV